MSALLEDVVTDKSTQLPQEGGEEEAAAFVAQEDTAGAASADGRKQLKRMRESTKSEGGVQKGKRRYDGIMVRAHPSPIVNPSTQMTNWMSYHSIVAKPVHFYTDKKTACEDASPALAKCS